MKLPLSYLATGALLSFLNACTAQIGVGSPDELGEDTIVNEVDDGSSIAYLTDMSVSQAIYSGCTTSMVRGLTDQLINQIECTQPGTLQSIADIPGVTLGNAALPFLQKNAADALARAVDRGNRTLHINSSLRSLAQQFLLYQWYRKGLCRNVVSLAARPGKSSHESGRALDVQDYSYWKNKLQAEDYGWLGSSDPVHFTYYGPSVDLAGLSVLAFQQLWNENNPEDQIDEDGLYGPQTEGALLLSPASGFPKGSTCAPDLPLRAIALDWTRLPDGSYDMSALAPNDVVRVEYLVEGYKIGEATRELSEEFPINYTFNYEKYRRLFEVLGYDAQGNLIGLGVGLIDSVPSTAVFIKQLGANVYEIGLERAPEVAAIEVRVDGFLLTDSSTGSSYSTRNAVRSYFNELGEREITITTYDADGNKRFDIYRTFTLK